VAASDVGGHRELVRDGHNGHLFPAGSAEALAQCLIKLLKTPANWDKVIANGREFVERERTWSASVARYRAVYTDVLDRQRRSTGGAHDR
jgi:glycosyltransferase involved in cell wall biosynthesis